MELNIAAWDATRLGEALESLARARGLGKITGKTPYPPKGILSLPLEEVSRWIEETATYMGLETAWKDMSYGEAGTVLKMAGPALVRVRVGGQIRFLALLDFRLGFCRVLAPDFKIHWIPLWKVVDAVRNECEAAHHDEFLSFVREAGIPEKHWETAVDKLLHDRLRSERLPALWVLKPHPKEGLWRQMRYAGLTHFLPKLLFTYTMGHLMWVLSWAVIGKGALVGHLDPILLGTWILTLLSTIPFRMWTKWYQGCLSIGVGSLIKQRLLYGAMNLQPEEIKTKGSGELLGRVFESRAVESLSLSTGYRALFSLVEMAVAFWVLGQGVGFIRWLLLLWIIPTAYACYRYYQARDRWTEARIHMTNDLVERMVGHRTRLVQEYRAFWHDTEDWIVARYLQLAREMDHISFFATGFIPRGWLLIGIAGMTPAVVSGSADTATLAVTLGGVLLAFRAFRILNRGFWSLSAATIAWRSISFLYQAAARDSAAGPPTFGLTPEIKEDAGNHLSLEVRDVVFRYRTKADPVLDRCSLRIFHGDRLLLAGPSGSGKTTLASLLLGFREPESGLILLHGLDRATLGREGWRRRITAAPQFHDNYILTGSLAFNLLMGRRWPAEPEDLVEAELVCKELGLGDLLDQMPAGLHQMVGENGWRLSHGEKSRVYIARALLQGAEIIIFDESFGALDPESLRTAMDCVFRRAPTLLVIAHP